MKTRLVRSNKGKTIHRSDCPQIQLPRQPAPWKWAENKTKATIANVVLKMGYKLCGTCTPLEGWNGPFHACAFRDRCSCEARCEAYDRHLAHQCCGQ